MANFIGILKLRLHAPTHGVAKERTAVSPQAILLPLALAQFLASYDTGSMNVAISRIVEDLNTTVTGVQAAITIFTLTMAALMIPGSKLSDIWGRKRCFVLGICIYAAGAFLTAFAPTLGVMILGFSLLEGIGSALMIPPIYILVTVTFTDTAARTKAFAVISAAAAVGSASGPLIGGLITTAVTWRLSFLCEVGMIAYILTQTYRIQDRGIEGPKPPFDMLGTVLSAAGLVFVVLGVLQAGTYGWIKARQPFSIGGKELLQQGDISPVVIFIAIGLVLLGIFALYIIRRERKGKPALIKASLFENRVVNLGLVTQNIQWFMMIGNAFVISVFLQVSRGYNAIETGLLLTPATIGILISSTRMGKITSRYSQRTIIRGGFVIVLAGIALILLFINPDSNMLLLAPGLFLVGFGSGVMLTTSVNVVQSALPDREQGEISGVSRSVSNLGSSLGTAVAGAVLFSALISGVSSQVADSAVLNQSQKEQLNVAMQGTVTTLSDAQVEAALEGQPQDVVDEVVRINAESRDRALGLALAAVAIFGFIGLAAAMFLPANVGRSAVENVGSG